MQRLSLKAVFQAADAAVAKEEERVRKTHRKCSTAGSSLSRAVEPQEGGGGGGGRRGADQ
jgi:hypothetical protein